MGFMGFGVKKIHGDVSGNSQAIVMGGVKRAGGGRPAQTAGPVWVGPRRVPALGGEERPLGGARGSTWGGGESWEQVLSRWRD